MEIVMNLTGCTQEDAERVLRECNNDPVEAVDKLLCVPETRGAPKKQELDETQKKFAEMRKQMEAMTESIESGFKKSDQHDSPSSQESSHIHVHPQEQLWSDSHHTRQSQIVIPELEEQTQETVYR